MTEDGGQRSEVRGRRTEVRGQRTEGGGQRMEDGGQRTEGHLYFSPEKPGSFGLDQRYLALP